MTKIIDFMTLYILADKHLEKTFSFDVLSKVRFVTSTIDTRNSSWDHVLAIDDSIRDYQKG